MTRERILSNIVAKHFSDSLPYNMPSNVFTLTYIDNKQALGEYIDSLSELVDCAYATNRDSNGELVANLKLAKLYFAHIGLEIK